MAGGVAGAAAAVRSVTENQTMLALRGGGDWLDRTLTIPTRTKCRPRKSSGGPEVERQAAQDIESFASSIGRLRHCCGGSGGERAAAAEAGGGALALLGEGVGAATEGLAVAGAGAALVGTAWAIEGGLNAASHLMGWGAATGGGTDSDASRPSMTTDVQTRNGMQESGAVDHYNIQEQRRAQRPEVFRIDTESESEPRNRPLPQVRSRPAPAVEAPGADPLRPEQRSHPRVLRQRTVPGQPPVPRRPGAPGNAAVLRGASSGERTGSCIGM